MDKILNFEDYLLEMIFENKKELPIVFSERLVELLKKIDHPVSRALLDINYDSVGSTEATLIDYDDVVLSKFTYFIPNKLLDIAKKDDLYVGTSVYDFKRFKDNNPSFWKLEQRPSTAIGKVVRKLLPGKFETPKKEEGSKIKVRNYIQEFTDLVIAEREKMKKVFERIKIVDGYDIPKYYNENKYDYSEGGGTLEDSCMKYDRCGKYMDFYVNGEVEMVVLMSEKYDDKIVGRALLWNIVEIDGEEVDRKFMDRIYSTRNSYTIIFQEYAKKNGWLYKNNQNMLSNEKIVDTKSGEIKIFKLKTNNDFEEVEFYPYLDTLKYFYMYEGYLTNYYDSSYDSITLDDTEGGPINRDPETGQYVEYYDDVFDPEDLQWCELGDDYRTYDDARYMSRYSSYATEEYIKDEMVWSEIYNDYLIRDYSIYSEYLEDAIDGDDAVEVYYPNESDKDYEIVKEEGNTDYVTEYYLDDFIFYNLRGKDMYFHPDDEDNFIKCNSLNDNGLTERNAHKVWDRDKIFRWKGEYWVNDSEDSKKFDQLVGQYRMFDNKNNNIK